jgi:hypothetical protein
MSSALTKRANLSSTTQPSPNTDPQGFWFCPILYQNEIEAGTEESAKSYDRPSENAQRPMNTLRRKSSLACSETSRDNRMLICLAPGLSRLKPHS